MWNRQFTRLRILDLHQYKSAIQSEWRQYQWKILFSLFSLLLLFFFFINGIEPRKWTKHKALCFDLIHLKHFTVSFLSSSLMLITQNASGVFPRPQHKWHSVIKSNIFVNESRFQILWNYHFFRRNCNSNFTRKMFPFAKIDPFSKSYKSFSPLCYVQR